MRERKRSKRKLRQGSAATNEVSPGATIGQQKKNAAGADAQLSADKVDCTLQLHCCFFSFWVSSLINACVLLESVIVIHT